MTTTLDADLTALLDAPSYAHLATVLPDGAPHSVPVWVGRHGDRIAVLTSPRSRKARNLFRDPRVALSITRPDSQFVMAVVRGRLAEVVDGDAAWAIIDGIARKYIGQPYDRGLERVVLLFEPETVHTSSAG
jgi:PPOX class probable F420-dependent enzyme